MCALKFEVRKYSNNAAHAERRTKSGCNDSMEDRRNIKMKAIPWRITGSAARKKYKKSGTRNEANVYIKDEGKGTGRYGDSPSREGHCVKESGKDRGRNLK